MSVQTPSQFRFLVGLLKAGQVAGLVPSRLDPDALEHKARKRTGLNDFGDPYYRQGLEVLCREFNDSGALNAYGCTLVESTFTNFLETRLLLQDLRARRAPELQTELISPLIVTGLARTGTTALHRMLAAAPGHRGVQWWELMSPLQRSTRNDVAQRIRFAKGLITPRKLFTPHLDAVHYIREDTLEECLWMIGCTFASRAPIEYLPCPAYLSFYLEHSDREKKYADYADLLRVLQARVPGQRLVLKSPEHMDGLDALMRHVPNALPIVTHRDPVQAIPSYASLSSLVHALAVKSFDPHALGRLWLDAGARSVDMMAQCRNRVTQPIYDHRYADMLREPVNCIERVHRFFDLPWNDTIAQAVARHTRENQQHKYGVHQYQTSDFGLTPEGISARFLNYTEEYLS